MGIGLRTLERHVYDPKLGIPTTVRSVPVEAADLSRCAGGDRLGRGRKARSAKPGRRERCRRTGAGRGGRRDHHAIADAMGGHLFNRTPVSVDMILNALSEASAGPQAASGQHGLREHRHDHQGHDAGLRAVSADTARRCLRTARPHRADAGSSPAATTASTWFKDRIKRPKAVVDITGIAELKGIRETPDGHRDRCADHADRNRAQRARARRTTGVLADAARRVASPQIRNTGTIGGNVSQDARCRYYRYGAALLSRRRQTCFADTPEGSEPRACAVRCDRCIAVSPIGYSRRRWSRSTRRS